MRFQLPADQVLVTVNNNVHQHHIQQLSNSTLDRLDNELAQTLRFSSNRIYDNQLDFTTTVNGNNRIANQDSSNLGRTRDFNNPTAAPNNLQNNQKEENGNNCFGDYNQTNLIYNEVEYFHHVLATHF